MTLGRRTALLSSWALLLPALLTAAVLLLAPLAVLGIESLYSFSLVSGVGSLTLGNYQRLLTDRYYLGILGQTFQLAAATAVLCLALGYPLALFLRLAPVRLRGLLVMAVIAPLLVSVVVRTFGWVVILGEFGLLNTVLQAVGMPASGSHLFTTTAVLTGLVHVFLPFMVLALYGALQKQPPRLLDAARNLGAGPLRAFLEVTLPLSMPGIVAGTTTVFALAAGAYVTVAVLGGSRVLVMAVLAYQQSVGLMNWQLGAAIGAVLLLGTTVLIQLFEMLARRTFPRVMA